MNSKNAERTSADLAWITTRPVPGQTMTDRPGWLLDSSTEFRWVFRPEVAGYALSHYTVSWEFVGGGSRVSKVREHYWRSFAQLVVVAYGASVRAKNKRVTSIVQFARLVRSFATWACYERACPTISEFNSDDVTAFEEYLRSLDLSRGRVGQYLGVLTLTWAFRNEIGEIIGVRAYRMRGEIRRTANRLGRRNGRTPTLPPEPFFRLLEHSLKLIEDGDRSVALAEKYWELKQGNNGEPCRVRDVEGVRRAEVIRAARELYGACIVLIFSLLGSRKHEVALLQVSDARNLVQDESDPGLLSGRVTKSSNGSGGSKTNRPVVPELKKAVEFVVRLTGADLERGEGTLFRPITLDWPLQPNGVGGLDTGQVYRLIGRFASSAGVDLVIRPHMFRRAFSMIYVWRYELGDLTHLSRILQHNDPRHTLAYAQGDDIKEFITDAERSLARSIMERALTGRERFGGGFGSFLERLGRRLRAATTVLRPDQIDSWLEPRLKDGQFKLRPCIHGYCIVLGDRGGRGACSTDGKSPDFANRTDQHCAACGNFLLTSRSIGYWQASLELHSEVLKLTKIEVVKKVAIAAMESAKRMLKSIGAAR